MDAPETIGRYRVLRTLGCGAMGVVYLAHDDRIDRKVAIKLVRTELLAGKAREEYLERFTREARAAGRCNHPAIVAIYDFDLHQGNPYLALEYVDGVGLDLAMGQVRRFSPATAVYIALQLLDALDSAHGVGVVHRDIKPANLMFMSGGRVKVTDFGLARLDDVAVTACGMVVGTPNYMSPEQWRGQGVDARSDLFSTAILLQEMLTGQGPFRGCNHAEIAFRVIGEPPAGMDEVETLAGDGVRALIERALAKAPEDRFESAAAMGDALREAAAAIAAEAESRRDLDATFTAMTSGLVVPPPAMPCRGDLAPADPPDASTGASQVDDALLSGIERRLAHHVGPIARYLVQNSVKKTQSVKELCDQLAQSISRPEERNRFLDEASRILGAPEDTGGLQATGEVPAAAGPIAAETIERAGFALAKTIGPIAKILVKRTLPKAQSEEDLWRLLATHIESATEREAFLRRRERA